MLFSFLFYPKGNTVIGAAIANNIGQVHLLNVLLQENANIDFVKGDYIEIVNLQTAPGTSGTVSTIGEILSFTIHPDMIFYNRWRFDFLH